MDDIVMNESVILTHIARMIFITAVVTALDCLH